MVSCLIFHPGIERRYRKFSPLAIFITSCVGNLIEFAVVAPLLLNRSTLFPPPRRWRSTAVSRVRSSFVFMEPLVFIRRDASHKEARSRLISAELDVTGGASGTVFTAVFHISCFCSSPTFFFYGDTNVGEQRATEVEVGAGEAADSLKINVWLRL